MNCTPLLVRARRKVPLMHRTCSSRCWHAASCARSARLRSTSIGNTSSKERLKKLERELAELKEKSSGLKAEWQKEKAVLEEQRKWKEELDQLRTELERAQRRGELARASEIQYGRIPELEKKLAAAAAKTAKDRPSLLREEVTEEDIAEVVSNWTHIPVSRLQEGEREKLV